MPVVEFTAEGSWITCQPCPGCGLHHGFAVPKWKFNGDVEKPTFEPSMNATWRPDGPLDQPKQRCHFFLTTGNYQFLGDCTHDLAGKTVPAPSSPE